MADLCVQPAHYAADGIANMPGYRCLRGPFFHEFAVRPPASGRRDQRRPAGARHPGRHPADGTAGIEHGLLICATEQNRKEDMDALVEGLEEVGR